MYTAGINDRGDLAGTYFDDAGFLPGLWTPDGTRVSILPDVRGDVYATALNDSRQVVGGGFATDRESGERVLAGPFVWSERTGVLALPGVAETDGGAALDINEAGSIVGWRPTGSGARAMLWIPTDGSVQGVFSPSTELPEPACMPGS